MNKINTDFRILGIIAVCLGFSGLAVSTVKLASRPMAWIESIPVKGQPSSSRVSSGMQISMRGHELEIILPNCTADLYPERFFLHAYSGIIGKGSDADFINMDFNLTEETPTWSKIKGITYCHYKKNFKNMATQEINIGQYEVIQGEKCCKIIWSRHYVVGTNN